MPRLSLVFLGFIFKLGILSYIVIILVIVETSDMTQLLANPIKSVRCVDNSSQVRIFPNLLLITIFLFLIPSLFIGSLAILGPQKV